MRPPLEPTPPAINPAETVALYREPIRTPRVETFVGHVRNPAAINGVRVVNHAAGRVVLPTPGCRSRAVYSCASAARGIIRPTRATARANSVALYKILPL
jgi:hypothetical protein